MKGLVGKFKQEKALVIVKIRTSRRLVSSSSGDPQIRGQINRVGPRSPQAVLTHYSGPPSQHVVVSHYIIITAQLSTSILTSNSKNINWLAPNWGLTTTLVKYGLSTINLLVYETFCANWGGLISKDNEYCPLSWYVQLQICILIDINVPWCQNWVTVTQPVSGCPCLGWAGLIRSQLRGCVAAAWWAADTQRW